MFKFKQAALAAAIAATAALTSSALAADKVLQVGLEPAFAPFEYYSGAEKQLVGFDIDFMNALGKEVGYEVKFRPLPFDGIIPALITGDINSVASGFTITEERQKRVDFSEPYYDAGLTIMIRKEDQNKLTSVKSLEKESLCVQIGSSGAEYIKKNLPKATVTAFNSAPEAFLQLRTKGCNAVINDKPVNDYFLATAKNTGDLITLPDQLNSEKYGIAVRKGDTELLNVINDGIHKLKANGQFQKIYDKWFKAN